MQRQLAHLEAAPSKCSQGQPVALERVLSNRLQFRESLDLPAREEGARRVVIPALMSKRAVVDALAR